MGVAECSPHPYGLGPLAGENKADAGYHSGVRYLRNAVECQMEKACGSSRLRPPDVAGWSEIAFALVHTAAASDHQRIRADAQVSPAPNAPSITRDPSLIRPSATASSSAIGIEAAEVLP